MLYVYRLRFCLITSQGVLRFAKAFPPPGYHTDADDTSVCSLFPIFFVVVFAHDRGRFLTLGDRLSFAMQIRPTLCPPQR